MQTSTSLLTESEDIEEILEKMSKKKSNSFQLPKKPVKEGNKVTGYVRNLTIANPKRKYKQYNALRQNHIIKTFKLAFYDDDDITEETKNEYIELFSQEHPWLKEVLESSVQQTDKDKVFDKALVIAEKAKEDFVVNNYGLIVSVATSYSRNSGIPLEDLCQVGVEGMLIAMKKFEISKKFKFSTFAVTGIRNAIKRYIANYSRTIRYPINIHEDLTRINIIEQELTKSIDRNPTDEELAKASGQSLIKIKGLKQLPNVSNSLDVPVSEEEGSTLGSFISDDNKTGYDLLEEKITIQQIREILMTSGLSNKEKEFILLKFGFVDGIKYSCSQVGERYSVTSTKVDSTIRTGIKKLQRNPKVKKYYN